jgi:hypothetical protein
MEFTKVVKFKLEGLKLFVTIDADQDGQASFTGEVNLPESAGELLGMFKKPTE